MSTCRETRSEVAGYFGSGETFVFRVSDKSYDQFFWVGMREGVGKLEPAIRLSLVDLLLFW